ncbi:MAG TPA: ATP-binding cassette domain-containing protein [Burkholderiaceae bacterium]|nr:ATP-binding cassette domain-containing protein [Burkholderiaceae bacterium]
MTSATSPSTLPPLVSFDRVTKRYDGDRAALTDVTFTLNRSEFVLLSGPSGAGKSTVVRLICGLELPTSGQVAVAGEDIARMRRRALPFLRRSIGIVLQHLLLLNDRTVLDNVALPALAAGLSHRDASERAQAALTRVALDPAVGKVRPNALSGGEQQRVALARAIVNRPALVLADEPTAHLDEQGALQLLQLLEHFVIAGVTVLMATHGEAAPLPGRARVLHIESGRVLQ